MASVPGPDGAARTVVEAAIADLGFRPVWLGDGLVFTRGWNRRLGLRLLTDLDDLPPQESQGEL